MSVKIIDGTGTSNCAKVTDINELVTHAHMIPFGYRAAHEDLSWRVTTNYVTISTTASYTGLFAIANSGSRHITIARFHISSTGNTKVKLVKNPTEGTLFSAGTVLTPVNSNFSGGNAAQVTAYKGSDAQTITDGTVFSCGYFKGGTLGFDVESAIVLDTNDSLGVQVQPESTSDIALSMWFFDDYILAESHS